jgi:hypothetical protein
VEIPESLSALIRRFHTDSFFAQRDFSISMQVLTANNNNNNNDLNNINTVVNSYNKNNNDVYDHNNT